MISCFSTYSDAWKICGLVDIYFILCAIVHHCFAYFLAQIVSALDFRSFLVGSCAILTWLIHMRFLFLFVISTLPSGLQDSMGYLVYFLLRLSHFFMESYFLLLEKGIRNQDMYTGYTCSYWMLLVLGPLAERGREYMCIC